jgi:hypothetical protein
VTERDTRAGVERHAIDLDRARRRVKKLPEVIAAQLAAARSSLDDCHALAVTAREYAGFFSVAEPAPEGICWGLRLAMDAQVSVFKGALAGLSRQPRVEIELEGKVAEVDSAVDGGFVNAANWIDAFYLTSVCREKLLLDALCQVPIDLLRRSPTRVPEYWILFAEALQAFWAPGDRDFYRLAHSAAVATTPSDPNVSDHALYVGGPQTDLLWSLMKALPGSPDGQAGVDRFNKSLAIALDYHRKFWDKEEDNRVRDPDGFLALPILGLVSMAYDSKVPVEVESDYMPRPLVEGACRRSRVPSATSPLA